MKHFLQKQISILLLLILLAGLLCPAAAADADMRRVVVGADLTEEQVSAVYETFGLKRGEVTELRLTNAEEHAALDGFVEQNIIGTRSISSVYLELRPQGSGVEVRTVNISWYTPEMYVSALTTAGITDAALVVTAPFSVSGTAALAGVYKAYEDMTGQKLDHDVKDAGTQELTVTGELSGEIGEAETASIISDLKRAMNQTAGMTDDEIRSTIRLIASGYRVNLTETQVQQLLDLCRSLEKLNPDQLSQRVEDVQSTLQKVSEAKDEVVSFARAVKNVIETLVQFFHRVSQLFGKEEA